MSKHEVVLYRNGDINDNGFPMSFTHKKYTSVGKFIDHVNEELEVAKRRHGYRFLYNMQGDEIKSIDDIEYGKAYVLALERKFVDIEYGGSERGSAGSNRSSGGGGGGSINRARSKSRDRDRERRDGPYSARRRGDNDTYPDYETYDDREFSDLHEDEKQRYREYTMLREKTRNRNRERRPQKEVRIRQYDSFIDGDSESESDSVEGNEIEIMVYRNGNYTDPGSYVSFDPDEFEYGRFSGFINYINEQMHLLGLSAGIRKVFTLRGEEVKKVSEIKHKTKYVVGGGQFIKMDYGRHALNLKGTQRPVTTSKKKRRRRRDEEDRTWRSKTHFSDISVIVFQNGKSDDPGQKMTIPQEKLQDVDDMLDFIKRQLGSAGRGLRSIYSEEGANIRNTRQVSDRDKIVVGSGKFIAMRYGVQLRHTKKIQKKVEKKNRMKRSRSDGDVKRRRSRSTATYGNRKPSEDESSTDPYEDYDDHEDKSRSRRKSYTSGSKSRKRRTYSH